MGLSSNIIWHQTDINGLKAILSSKCFLCSYSLETIQWNTAHVKRAFPMISFCNIPISDLEEYLTNNKDGKYSGKYGKYTIGLKHSWATKNGIAPVWYLNKQASCLQEIMQYHSRLMLENWTDFENLVWRLLSNIKNYEGELIKYGFKSYRFYDEKEIRYVPDLQILQNLNVQPVLDEKGYENYKKQNKKSALIEDVFLPFEIEDISYILVSNANQTKRLKELLGDNKDKVTILSYTSIIEDIIGKCHTRKK